MKTKSQPEARTANIIITNLQEVNGRLAELRKLSSPDGMATAEEARITRAKRAAEMEVAEAGCRVKLARIEAKGDDPSGPRCKREALLEIQTARTKRRMDDILGTAALEAAGCVAVRCKAAALTRKAGAIREELAAMEERREALRARDVRDETAGLECMEDEKRWIWFSDWRKSRRKPRSVSMGFRSN